MPTNRLERLLVCAGESSGDALAAAWLAKLRERGICPEVRGIAGPKLRAAGVDPLAKAESLTAVGLVEAVRQVPRVACIVRRVVRAARAWQPQVVLTVDSPGALLPLARRLRAPGRLVTHWVSPQLWAWRPGRAARIAECCDLLLCLFPMEPMLYNEFSLDAVYVGHPALGLDLPPRIDRREQGPVIGFAPGSRPAEVRALWPVLCQVATRLRQTYPQARYLVLVAPTVSTADLTGLQTEFVSDVRAFAAQVNVAAVCSGTLTLELTALQVPMVVLYRVHPLTYGAARVMVRGTSHLALPNILAQAAVVPEVVQHLRPRTIAHHLARLLGPAGVAQQRALGAVKNTWAVPDAVDRAVQAVVERIPGPGMDPRR